MRKLYVLQYGDTKETYRDFLEACQREKVIKSRYKNYNFYWYRSRI